MLLMAILGGIGTIAGPILGSAAVIILSEIFSLVVGHQGRLILFGLILTFMAIYLPGGLLSVKEKFGFAGQALTVFEQKTTAE
jgi:branched-chain amino acid transport system permease protein